MGYHRLMKSRVLKAVWLVLAIFTVSSPCRGESRALNSDNPVAVRLYEEALQMVDEEKFDTAIEKFSRAIRLDPQFLKAHFRYMDVMRVVGRGEEIIEEYRKKADQNPQNALEIYLYGRAMEDMSQKQRQYRAALEADPEFYWAQYGIGGIYLVQRRYDEAIIALNKTLEMNPKMVEAIHLMGTVYLEKGMLIQARERFEEAVAIDSKNNLIYMSLGQVYSQLDKLESAEKAFRKAAELAPKNAMTYYYIGLICEMQNRPEQAVVAYESFLRLDPDHELAPAVKKNINKLKK